MRIQRDSINDWKIEFVYSPLFEMFCSLHVLFNPEHHKMRSGWAHTTHAEMDKNLFAKLDFFNEVTSGYMGAMEFVHLGDEFCDFNIIRSIDYIEKQDVISFLYLIFNKTIKEFDIKKILTLEKVHITGIKQEWVEVLLEPEKFKVEFISCLKEYYYLHFQEIQMEIEPYLVKTLKSHKVLGDNMDFLDYLSILHPRIEKCDDRISLHKYKRFDFMFEDIKKIEIGISTFIDPHLLMGEDDRFLSLTIRAKINKVHSDVHEDMIKALKALGDKTRMKIIKCLYEKPTSTQELSSRLEVSEAGISKHLKILFNAKVINKIRQGNYILYFLDKLSIDRIPMDVYQYLDE